MADQMTPDELRIAAEDVDNWTDPTGNAHVAAQAARNLADVIEYAELRAWCHDHGVLNIGDTRIYQTPEETVAHVLRIARGETNEREKP